MTHPRPLKRPSIYYFGFFAAVKYRAGRSKVRAYFMASHRLAKRGKEGSAAAIFTIAANALRDKNVSPINLG